jgi:type II secretory pathway pseudopilin PulG
MKRNGFHRGSRTKRGGFSLVEACFTIGVLGLGFVTLVPLAGLGLKTARGARDDRESAQIARTLVEQERQGTLGSGPVYLDDQGAASSPTSAAFVAQPVTQQMANGASQLMLRVTPVGAPNRARFYAVVLPVAAEN